MLETLEFLVHGGREIRHGAEMLPFPVKYLDEELPEPRMAPTVGEHNEEVLREVLGYDAEKIAALREDGVFG